MFDIATFRASFPEFSDTSAYPDAMLTYWGRIADQVLNECVFGGLVEHVRSLFVAHNITMARQNVRTSSVGMIPGTSNGTISSKSVGSASISYDTADSTIQGADSYNLSTYGKMFYHYVLLYGAGCVQL